jgi:hypothetical protein
VASLVAARPLSPEDAEALLPFDQEYALRYELEPILTKSSLSFFVRSGHSFTAYAGNEARGFVLAQAIWNGTRPTVYVSRLATSEGELTVKRALLEAVTKSAYDAAVYDLIAMIPEGDEESAAALRHTRYGRQPLRLYGRVLGSRAARAEP